MSACQVRAGDTSLNCLLLGNFSMYGRTIPHPDPFICRKTVEFMDPLLHVDLFWYNVLPVCIKSPFARAQGSYSPIILKNIFCLFLHDFVNLNVTQLLIG